MPHRNATLVLLGLALLSACAGRDQPHLFSVVSLPDDRPGGCLPLREPSLASLSAAELDALRPPSDDYVWLVGETVEGPTGLAGALSSLTGRSALVSLTSSTGGRPTTRAVATVEKGKLTHTYFGTPLTPPFPNDDGTQLALAFDARVLDASALSTAKAVLGAVPAGGAQYGQIIAAIVAPPDDREEKPQGVSQTYVLADPRTCASGACQAVIAQERLVVLSAASGRSASELAPTVCLRGARLYATGGVEEYGGSYAVLRLAHARLPEEALGDELAGRLASLARCDHDFGPELAAKAEDALAGASLRATDREVVAALVKDTATAAKARTPEERLEAERRLARSTKAVCAQTPADGVACARARSLTACATSRASDALATREAYGQARSSLEAVEGATTCDTRAQGLVALSHDFAALSGTVREAHLEGSCAATATGLSCEAFPEMSRHSKAVVAEAQDALYHQCYCAALGQDRAALTGARVVREALRCEQSPEEFTLQLAADAPLKEVDVAEWQSHRQTVVPALTAVQCPACVRLGRRIDDELARAVVMGRNQAAVALLLRDALAPVTELHDRAFMLMSGDAAVRCSARPDEWSIIAQALQFSVEPRDIFREGGQLDPPRLEAKLARARLLKSSLDGLSCLRETAVPMDLDDLPRLSAHP